MVANAVVVASEPRPPADNDMSEETARSMKTINEAAVTTPPVVEGKLPPPPPPPPMISTSTTTSSPLLSGASTISASTAPPPAASGAVTTVTSTLTEAPSSAHAANSAPPPAGFMETVAPTPPVAAPAAQPAAAAVPATPSASAAPAMSAAAAPRDPSSSPNKEAGDGMVTLHVYDITTPDDPTLIPRLNNTLYKLGIGVFHSGVEVYGVEYAFGGHYDDLSGIFTSPPKQAQGVVYRCSVELGRTPFPRKTVDAIVDAMGNRQFLGNNYSLINNNCNNFSEAFVQCLMTEKAFPGWINRLAGIAINVSCILPPAVEQPLSELAPTAANMDRRRTSIAAPPPSTRSEQRKHSTVSQPGSAASGKSSASPHRRSSTSALCNKSTAEPVRPANHLDVDTHREPARVARRQAAGMHGRSSSLAILPDDDDASSSSSDDEYYRFPLACPPSLMHNSSTVTSTVASVTGSPPRPTLSGHPGKMIVRPQSPTPPPRALTRLSFSVTENNPTARSAQGRVFAVEDGRFNVRFDSPGSPVSQASR